MILRVLIILAAVAAACCMTQPGAAAGLRFDRVPIAGADMNLPRGWQRQQDDYSLILTESPQSETSAVLALYALVAQPGNSTSPAQLADAIHSQLDLASHGYSVRLLEERHVGPALYRLHTLHKGQQFGYLASYSHTERASGALIHMFFSALEQRFIDLGGTVLPLVAFAGLKPALIEQIKTQSAALPPHSGGSSDGCKPGQSYEVCLAEQWFGPGGKYEAPSASAVTESYTAECKRRTDAARNTAELNAAQTYCTNAYRTASQMLRMSHETSMKILYNIDSGWCYRGESGCN